MKKWATEFKRGRERAWSGRPKDAAADENVEIVHKLVNKKWLCVTGGETCEVGISFGAVRYLWYVQGLGKMGIENVG